ncbi:hypothetical protein G7046_g9700 [Stylonectria norvegica]|nr:hypothetical protein G7046_g9700 [Stylonectria norvegica]
MSSTSQSQGVGRSPCHSPSLCPSPRNQLVSSTSTSNGASESPNALENAHSHCNIQGGNIPEHRFYTADFQAKLEEIREILNDTAMVMKESHNFRSSPESCCMWQRVTELSEFKTEDSRKIAITGGSEDGKSGIINSLLDIPGLAPTEAVGSRCTSVVTEYRQKPKQFRDPIVIEVDFLESCEMEEMVSQLLETSQRAYDECNLNCCRESLHAEAWSALQAAFSHQPLFDESYLFRNTSDDAFQRRKSQLVQWASELKSTLRGHEGLGEWVFGAKTSEECCKLLQDVTQGRYYPFIRLIRIYVDAEILKNGIVLVDFPETMNSTLAKCHSMEDYLKKCGNVLIAAKMSEAATDSTLLRRFCHKIAADAQLREAKHFFESILPGVMNFAALWGTALTKMLEYPALPKAAAALIDDTMQDTKADLRTSVRKLGRNLRRSFRELFIDFADHRIEAWKTAAEIEGNKWQLWDPNQYHLMCAQNGIQTTPTGSENWNAKIIWKMRLELTLQWELVEEDIHTHFEGLRSSSRAILDELLESVSDELPTGIRLKLSQAVESSLVEHDVRFKATAARLAREVSILNRHYSEVGEQSYIFRAMRRTYAEAASQTGPNQGILQVMIVQRKIMDEALFADMCYNMFDDLAWLVQRTERELLTAMKSTVDMLHDLVSEQTKDHFKPQPKGVRDDVHFLADQLAKLKVKADMCCREALEQASVAHVDGK